MVMLTQVLILVRSYDMNIDTAQYNKNIDGNIVDVKVTDGDKTYYVPLDPNNTDYEEILRQVKEGTLTIQDAD